MSSQIPSLGMRGAPHQAECCAQAAKLKEAMRRLSLLSGWDHSRVEKRAEAQARAGGKITLDVRDSSTGEVTYLAPNILVNAAGLQAQEVASVLKGLHAEHVPKRYLARGCYFSLSGWASAV